MSALTTATSATFADIKDIIQPHTEKYSGTFTFEVKLHTVEKDLDKDDKITLVEMLILRDYIANMSDYTEIMLTIPLGTYVYDVYPHLNNVELTLVTTKQLSKEGEVERVSERYKAVYLLEKNSNKPTMSNMSKDDLNQQMPTTLSLQLIDRGVEVFRIKTTQGSFDTRVSANSSMNISEFLRSLVSEEVNKILVENKPILEHVNIEPVDNTEPLQGVVIPSGTRVIDLPNFIQEKGRGIYVGGVGSYIQNFGTDAYITSKGYYIYSLFKPSKYETAKNKIIIYSPVSSNYSLTDVTYKKEPGLLKILSHTIPNLNDLKESRLMSIGSGFRSSNASSFMSKPVILTEEGPEFDRSSQNTEIIDHEREDGLNYAPNIGVTANQFSAATEVMKSKGSYVEVEVSNLDPDFLFPAAPVKIVYDGKDDEVVELYGVIHQVAIKYSSPKLDIVSNLQRGSTSLGSHTVLSIFVET